MSDKYLNSVGKGWHVLLKPILIEAERIGAKIFQIKEKFGALTIYVYCDPEIISSSDNYRIQRICEAAQTLSNFICEECGAPGVNKQHNGRWFKTLCEVHAKCRKEWDPKKQEYVLVEI